MCLLGALRYSRLMLTFQQLEDYLYKPLHIQNYLKEKICNFQLSNTLTSVLPICDPAWAEQWEVDSGPRNQEMPWCQIPQQIWFSWRGPYKDEDHGKVCAWYVCAEASLRLLCFPPAQGGWKMRKLSLGKKLILCPKRPLLGKPGCQRYRVQKNLSPSHFVVYFGSHLLDAFVWRTAVSWTSLTSPCPEWKCGLCLLFLVPWSCAPC